MSLALAVLLLPRGAAEMVLVGGGRNGVGAWGRGELGACLYFAITA